MIVRHGPIMSQEHESNNMAPDRWPTGIAWICARFARLTLSGLHEVIFAQAAQRLTRPATGFHAQVSIVGTFGGR